MPAREGSTPELGIPGKSPDVKLIDDGVGLMMWQQVVFPVEGRTMGGERSQRGAPRVRSFSRGQRPVKSRRKEDAFRVRVKKNLLRVEGMKRRPDRP